MYKLHPKSIIKKEKYTGQKPRYKMASYISHDISDEM
jgi:hypothetical protein